MAAVREFKDGDIVQYTRKFLQSVGWYTDVPIDGKITGRLDDVFVYVHWCDRDDPILINAGNLKLKSAWEPN